MDYKKLYAEKLVSAEKAASVVKSGDWVDYGWTTGTPVAVDAAIAKRLPELENVNFRGGILMWVPEIFKIENPAAHMTWNSWHMSGIERKAIAQGFSFYAPIRYSELPRYYRESATKPDVASRSLRWTSTVISTSDQMLPIWQPAARLPRLSS
jgi:acyl-CoA hydrolase